MTVEELRSALIGKEYPSEVQISKDQKVTDVERFLRVQFEICDSWGKDITKCPAYSRLVKFHEATKK